MTSFGKRRAGHYVWLVLSALALLHTEEAYTEESSKNLAKFWPAAKELISQLDRPAPQDIWSIYSRLSALGPDAAPIIAGELEKAGEVKRLVLARALCSLGEPGHGARVLLELARTGSTSELRAAAARAIGTTVELSGLEPIAEALVALLAVERDDLVKCALAEAIFMVSDEPASEARVKAVATLKDMLDSTNARASREATLVLGENGFESLVRTRLIGMASEPTPEGRRALMALRAAKASWANVLGELLEKIEQAYVEPARLDRNELLNAAAKGMAKSLDDFSDYLTEPEVQDMEEIVSQSYEGIGAWVGLRDGYFTIISPVYGGPAAKAGIRSLDRIVEVDGHRTDELGFEKTVRRLKGPKGTKVEIKVMRRGWSEPQTFSIVREEIRIDNCYSTMLPGNIGYLRLARFGERSGEEVRSAVFELMGKGAWALVLDLRDNGGGLLSAAVEVADIFLGPGKVIVYSQGRPEVAPLRRYISSTKDKLVDLPLVVLVNSGSASASEIVAGALQDWGRARLVGERSFGKGSVQSLIPIKSTGGKTKLRLTIARYYLPTGRTIDRHGSGPGGVEPDVVVKEDGIPAWESEEIARLNLHERIDEHIRNLFEKDPALVARVAESDGRSLDSYPGLRTLLASFNSRVSERAARMIARAAARRLVADERARMFVCDPQEDNVLRRGVYELLEMSGKKLDLAQEYSDILQELAHPAKKP